MINGKSLLRHEVLNIITLLNFLILDTNLKEKKKQEILGQLKMLALLNIEEEFILTNRRDFFNQEIDLNELLLIITQIIEPQAQEKRVKIEMENLDLTIFGDVNVVKNGLENLFFHLIHISKSIFVSSIKKSRELQIKYEADQVFELDEVPLLNYLKEKHDYSELLCKISIEVMKRNGTKLNFKKGLIRLKFPK